MPKDKEKKQNVPAKETKSVGKLPNVSEAKTVHIPRNVNYYSHFLVHPYITEKDVEWVLKLRDTKSDSQELQARLAKIPNQAFNVADRKTTSSEVKHTVTDLQMKGNATNYIHLLRHRIGPTTHQGQVLYETGLRSYLGDKDKDKEIIEKERKWSNVPYKDKKNFPEFTYEYKQEASIRKQMSETGKQMKLTYSGFDGDQNYPSYHMKFKQRNLQDIKHLFAAPGAKMSAVQWQEGLRELKPVKHEDTEKKGKNQDKHSPKRK